MMSLPLSSSPRAGDGDLWLAGFSAAFLDAVRASSAGLGLGIRVLGAEEARPEIDAGVASLVAIGPEWKPEAAAALLEHFFGGADRSEAAEHGARPGLALVLAGGDGLERFQPFLDLDRLFYLSAEPPPEPDALRLIVAAAERLGQRRARPVAGEGELAEALGQRLGEIGTAAGPVALVDTIEAFVEQSVEADRCTCWLYEATSETLHSPPRGERAPRQESAAVGLVSYVLRTGHGVRVERVGDDPRYDSEADNSGGPTGERLLAVPLLAGDLEEAGSDLAPVLGVLTAIRTAEAPPFGAEDEERLRSLAAPGVRALAPALAPMWGLSTSPPGSTPAADGPDSLDARRQMLGDEAGLFREQALDHYHDGLPDHGRVLEIGPVWAGRMYRLLLLLLVSSLIFVVVGRINEYAEGRGGVRLEGRTDVSAPVAGTVSEVLVRDGERVRAGDVLVRLHGAQESAELHRLEREFELGLLERLRHPADPIAARALGALRAQQQAAESRLDERSVRASRDGVVSDLRVRPGQLISPGEIVLSLGAEAGELVLVAVLPGRFRPQLELGMPLRFELEGYRYAYQHLELDAISDEVFGPSEAKRALGPGLGDAIDVRGPVVLVEARLPSSSFESDGRTYDYFDGSLGKVEVRVRSEPILVTLVPGLGVLWEGAR